MVAGDWGGATDANLRQLVSDAVIPEACVSDRSLPCVPVAADMGML